MVRQQTTNEPDVVKNEKPESNTDNAGSNAQAWIDPRESLIRRRAVTKRREGARALGPSPRRGCCNLPSERRIHRLPPDLVSHHATLCFYTKIHAK
jgi:hypothetical protein